MSNKVILITDTITDLFIDENGSGPGVRLGKRHQKKSQTALSGCHDVAENPQLITPVAFPLHWSERDFSSTATAAATPCGYKSVPQNIVGFMRVLAAQLQAQFRHSS